MRLEQLEYLLITAKCHSMSKASTFLHVSQQNISKAIRDLETELGLTIFERTSHGVFLTSEGKQIFKLASQVCDGANKIKNLYNFNKHKSLYQDIEGFLPILTIPGYSDFAFSLLKKVRNYCPKISISIVETESIDIIQKLHDCQFDCAFTTLPQKKNFITDKTVLNNYDFYIFHYDQLKVLTTVSSPLIQYHNISDKQFSLYPVINYRSPNCDTSLVEMLLREQYIPYNTIFNCNSTTVFTEALTSEESIALTSDFVFKSALRNNPEKYVLLPMTSKLPIIHVYIRKKQLSDIGELLDHLIMNKFAEFNLVPQLYSYTI